MIQIFDNVLSPVGLQFLQEALPREMHNNPNVVHYNNTSEYKNALDLQYIKDTHIIATLARLRSLSLEHLRHFDGTPDVTTDPKGRGCGIHHLPVNGFLDLHVDGNWHPELEKRRYANAVFYISGDNSSPFHYNYDQIEFIPNRLVLFTTLDDPLHGCPVPCTKDRYTLSIFFYCDGKKPRFPRRAWFPNASNEFTQQRTPLQ